MLYLLVLKKEFCDQKILCDAKALEHLKNKFLKWVTDTSNLNNEVPRSVAINKEFITAVNLPVFGDASIVASCAVVYAAVHQTKG